MGPFIPGITKRDKDVFIPGIADKDMATDSKKDKKGFLSGAFKNFDPVNALAGFQGAIGLAQGLTGLLTKNDRPEYEEVYKRDHLNERERMAKNRLANPYAEKDRAIESSDLSISDNLESVREGKTGGRVDESALFNAAMTGRMAVADRVDQNKRLAESSLDQVLQDQSAYDKGKLDFEMDKFNDTAAMKSAMIGSGATNMLGAGQVAVDGKLQKDHLDFKKEELAKYEEMLMKELFMKYGDKHD